MTTTLFDNVTGTTSKNIKFATDAAYKEWNDEYKQIGIVEKTDQKYEQFIGYEGPGALTEKTEGADVTEHEFREGYKTTIPQKTWTNSMAISWEQREYAVGNSGYTKNIGYYQARSAKLRYEYSMAAIRNNGFTDSAAYHGGDSKPLYSASHPWKSGSTYSNLLTAADLTKTTLESALQSIASAKMENNLPASLMAEKVVIAYENIFKLPELLKSNLDPESGNNTYNVFKDFGLGKFLSHYLTDTDSWYIDCAGTYTAIIESKAPGMRSYLDDKTNNLVENIWTALNTGFKDQLNTFGNAGA